MENVVVKIVKSRGYDENESLSLISGLKARLGEEMKIRIEYVDSINRTVNGKFKWVISRVPTEFNRR